MVRPPANLTRYTQLPGLPRGYPIGDALSVIVPEATVNLILNPSCERATTGYTASNGSAIARSAAQQARGVYSLAVTPSSNVNSGTYYTPAAVTAAQVYAYSVDVWGAPGVPYRIAITDSSANILARLEFRGEGRWRRYSVAVTPGVTAIRLYVEKNNSASTAVFYIDGVMLEAKAYSTTYTDGDLVGFVSTRADFYWTGTPHASTSVRSAQTRVGGRVMNLAKYGFTLMTIIGLGMTPWANVSQPAGLLGGAYYQHSTPQARAFTLLGDMREAARPALDRRQGDLIDVLRPDLVTPTQPLILRYQLLDDCTGEPLGDALDIECSLEGSGPGNTIDNSHGATESMAFRTYLPLIQKALSGGASLGVNSSVANANYILQRSPVGAWSALGTGLSGFVDGLVYGSDGALYVGGGFSNAGGIAAADFIAKWDGSAWSALGTGGNNAVDALAVGPDGALYAGGIFTLMGGVANTVRIAKWDGSAWSALGTGINGVVWALVIGPDGTLYAGGAFTSAGGTVVSNIAKWDGSTWTVLGTGLNGTCLGLAIGADGSLYAGGEFTTAGGVTVNGIAKWSNSAWSALGTGMAGGATTRVYSIGAGKDGTIYAGGEFTSASGVSASNIAAWNGVTWRALGAGANNIVRTLAVAPDGTLWAGGVFTAAGGLTLPDRVARWNGSTWFPIDADLPGAPVILELALDNQGTFTVGWDSTTGTATVASVTSVTVGGSMETWARVEFVGPGVLVQLVNETTDQAIYFNLTLLASERAVLDLRPDRLSFVSSFRGDISNTILPGSQETTWRLQPGVNSISVFMTGTTAASEALLSWREAHGSVQSGTP